jgi:toxin ParE1/3/4
MSLNVIEFQAEARTELLDAIDYYSDIQAGLAEQFVAAVEHASTKICSFPEAGTEAAAGTRKIRVKKFPFNVIYQVEDGKIAVVAIAHHSRKPNYWVKRL